jgi:hypothetical protein
MRMTMMFMVTFIVYSKHHMKPIRMLYGQNVELYVSFKLGGMKATKML